ncbi:MAG: response regulator [Chitinophagales bacterium]|nr:response regulator [Chitinophagales bacterium]
MTTTNQPLVMMIDDNEIDLFVNKKFLRVSGITDNTISFISAKDALNYISANATTPEKLPKLILLDIQMPEINGFRFLELFQDAPESAQHEMKIIMLSSTLDPLDIEKARCNRFVVDILKKPLDPAALKEALKNHA